MRKVNGIYVTSCVTFPRSGHHWLTRMLELYFSGRINYCEIYHDLDKKIDLCPETNYEKSHDFDLKYPILNDRKYLIQIRDFDNASISYYRLSQIKWRYYGTGIPTDKPVVDPTSSDYLQFKSNIQPYYNSFIQKWVVSYIPNSKLVVYDTLYNNTLEELRSIVSFLSDDPIDESRLLLASQTK
jgi:hypothetical protein